ncbi:MAG: hypothetical protein IPH20_05755 [Bacteroidales bacterium]|nr:hypothetical protein [Bacteroidales bacterium]
MKKFNTWTAVLILISILLYATLALGKQDKGLRIRHSGSDRNTGAQNSNLNEDSCQSDRNNNITSEAVFNLIKRLKLN